MEEKAEVRAVNKRFMAVPAINLCALNFWIKRINKNTVSAMRMMVITKAAKTTGIVPSSFTQSVKNTKAEKETRPSRKRAINLT